MEKSVYSRIAVEQHEMESGIGFGVFAFDTEGPTVRSQNISGESNLSS
jgi:hypothetical protein